MSLELYKYWQQQQLPVYLVDELAQLMVDEKAIEALTLIKRLESLENIAKGFEGVDNAYAIQAGRELRIMVNSDTVNDDGARKIAKGIADRIEAELRYPGKIKVTIIRETRVVEYAK